MSAEADEQAIDAGYPRDTMRALKVRGTLGIDPTDTARQPSPLAGTKA